MSRLRPEALSALRADVGEDHARGFVVCFLATLESRVGRLSGAVDACDTGEAYVAALSLHASAVMVGATDLAETLRCTLAPLRRGDLVPARAVLGDLPACVRATSGALTKAVEVA
ncbi:hypothetical protein [Georgenia subflava]|uniref:HPt domain-containing protein n=1 Tax=Georgenia subflava TaxID=1622177 RepID=A0A6N7EHY8_9MICO|nr:hypothetical protein [Georgenia subflava]MPV36245.1 hypothetical protein [Georgenia subflava]